MIHELKTWPQYYNRVADGQKTFEVRKNDRDFQVGDELVLVYYNPEEPRPMEYGMTLKAKVTYILYGGQFGIEPGYCVMAIELIEKG